MGWGLMPCWALLEKRRGFFIPKVKICCPDCRRELTGEEDICPKCGRALRSGVQLSERQEFFQTVNYPELRIGADEKILFTSGASFFYLRVGGVWCLAAFFFLAFLAFRMTDSLWEQIALLCLLALSLCWAGICIFRYFRRERRACTLLTPKKIYSTGAYRRGFLMESAELPVSSVLRFQSRFFPGIHYSVQLELFRDQVARDRYDIRFFSAEDYREFVSSLRALLREREEAED